MAPELSAKRLDILRTLATVSAPASQRSTALPELDLVELVRDAAEERKGEDILVLDLAGRTIVADAFVLVTGRSVIQIIALPDGCSIASGMMRSSRYPSFCGTPALATLRSSQWISTLWMPGRSSAALVSRRADSVAMPRR